MNKNIKLKSFQLILIILIAVLGGYFFGTYNVHLRWSGFRPLFSANSAFPPPTQNVDFSLMYQILDKVNSDYYDKSKVDPQKLLYGAIEGMLASLDDPYTSFFPPTQNTAFKTQMAGQFSGIGAELGLKDNKIIVVSPLDGSPSKKAGLKAGDIIQAVDGKDTAGWDLNKAVDTIRGPKGSPVTLTILHEGSTKSVDMKITRDDIKIDSVTSWVKQVSCDGNSCKDAKNCASCATVGYIRISQFGDRTNDEWLSNIDKINSQFKKSSNVKGLILDLRNNPGGYLNDAVFIASEFISKNSIPGGHLDRMGAVVLQQDSSGQITQMTVNRDGSMLNVPLVVLINKGSASAAEIVSGALRDQGRATLVGDNSFGKGTVQQAIDVDGGASVHISIAKWLTPDGNWVGNGKNGQGLTPDVKVSYDAKKSPVDGFDNQLQTAIQQLLK